MRLQLSTDKACVPASLGMVLDINQRVIKEDLMPNPPVYPFPAPWDKCPLVPSMDKVCDWCWDERKVALIPFVYDPQCTPHVNCPPQPVWQKDPMRVFERQLAYGPGLLEGTVEGVGHMCAWDGQTIFDPRGYTYSRNVASSKFDYLIARFWLAVGYNK